MYQTIARFLGDLFGGTPAPLTVSGGSMDYLPLEIGSESSESAYDALKSHQPAFNTDGTPMMGDFDVNGHTYGNPARAFFQADGGSDSTSWSSFDSESSFSSSDSWNASSDCGSGDTFDSF